MRRLLVLWACCAALFGDYCWATLTNTRAVIESYDYGAYGLRTIAGSVGCTPGDFTGDGMVTTADIAPFVVGVLAGTGTAEELCQADLGGPGGSSADGLVDGLDIQPFVDCLLDPLACPPPTSGGPTTGSVLHTPFTLHGRPADLLDPDPTTGEPRLLLQYNRARYYDIKNARWLQRDPVGFADGPNLYDAFRNNPIRWTDSTGLIPDPNEPILTGDPERDREIILNQSKVFGSIAGGLFDIVKGLVVSLHEANKPGRHNLVSVDPISRTSELIIQQTVMRGAILQDRFVQQGLSSGEATAGAVFVVVTDFTGLNAIVDAFEGKDIEGTVIEDPIRHVTPGVVQLGATAVGVRFVVVKLTGSGTALATAPVNSIPLARPVVNPGIAGTLATAEAAATNAARARLLANIAESQAGRAASNFEVFVARERTLAIARSGAAPVRAGQAGVARTVAKLEQAGFLVRGEQITIETIAARTRLDLFAEAPPGGGVIPGTSVRVNPLQEFFVEVKTGPTARLSRNQRLAIPIIKESGGIPRGVRAKDAGLPPGTKTGSIVVVIVRQP